MLNFNNKLVLALLLVVFACLWRVLGVYNFSPIAATALFSGALFGRKAMAFILPLVVLFVSDLLVNTFVYQMPNPFAYFFKWEALSVYPTYIVITLIGGWVGLKGKYARVPMGAITSSALFFVVTNTAAWASDSMYTKNIAGLIESYTLALPFVQNTFWGDMVFAIFFFGSYYLAQNLAPAKQKIQ